MIFFLVSCNGQKVGNNKVLKEVKKIESTSSKKNIMEKFDIINFNKHQENNEWNFTNKNGDKERQIKDGEEGYSVEVVHKNNPFNDVKYFHRNGMLAQIGEQFHGGFLKGAWYDYDEKGILVKETDYDLPYKNHPWEKVKEYLESRKVDLVDNFTRVWRDNKKVSNWVISWDTKKIDNMGNQIINNVEIDSNTGKVVKENTSLFGEK